MVLSVAEADTEEVVEMLSMDAFAEADSDWELRALWVGWAELDKVAVALPAPEAVALEVSDAVAAAEAETDPDAVDDAAWLSAAVVEPDVVGDAALALALGVKDASDAV